MTIYHLKTPLTEQETRNLRVNDILYLTGTIVTARDQAHKKALETKKQGKSLPLNLDGLAVFHCGPLMRKEKSKWVAVSAGPTTSTRMETYTADFLREFQPRIIIGKGGMGKKTSDALTKYGAVYCAFTGGAAVLAAQSIKSVKGVEWLDLGMPEAMWIFEVEEFGPMIVALDSKGSNLFFEVAKKVEDNDKKYTPASANKKLSATSLPP